MVGAISGSALIRGGPTTVVRFYRDGVLVATGPGTPETGFSNFMLGPTASLTPGQVFTAEAVGELGTGTCSTTV
jgi:hypothetical protein